MSHLTILRGLPGSGKTTFALAELKRTGNAIRVNRDELRIILHGPDAKWSGERERVTAAAETAIVRDALLNKKNVIIDDTNLLGSGTARWTELAASLATVHIEDFTKTVSIEECIARDRGRSGKARVGRGVIERMALQAGLIDLGGLNRVAIIDVDGTLSCLDHRLVYMLEPKD